MAGPANERRPDRGVVEPPSTLRASLKRLELSSANLKAYDRRTVERLKKTVINRCSAIRFPAHCSEAFLRGASGALLSVILIGCPGSCYAQQLLNKVKRSDYDEIAM